MYKKDDFNTDKPIQTYKGNFIRETEVYVSQHCTPMARRFTLNNSPCDCYAKNLSF